MAGDPIVERVRAVYETGHARLWRAVLAFTGSRDVTDDAVAEAFAQVLRRGDVVRDVEAWVWRSAFAIARGDLARRGSAPTPMRSAGGLGDAEVELGVDAPESALDLVRGLQALPVADRELLVLCHIGGWTPSELAAMTGTPASTIRVRLHRANRRARPLFEEDRQ